MTDNVPLIFDLEQNKIKELPVGNNLDLTGSGITNAELLTVKNINLDTVNNQTLAAVAFSNDYEDLENTPPGSTNDYNDLTNKPNIPEITKNLDDISEETPLDGNALIYNASEGQYKPQSILNQTDLDTLTLGSLSNVITQATNVTDKFLKFSAGAWRPSKVQYAEVQNTPTAVSAFTNDSGYLTQQDLDTNIDFKGSVFSDDSTLLVDGVNSSINLKETIDDNIIPKDSNNIDLGSAEKPFNNIYLSSSGLFSGSYTQLSNLPNSITEFGITDGSAGQVLTTDGAGNFTFEDAGDQIGNFTLALSTIDTDDSSPIQIIPSLVLQSNLEVQNDVVVQGSVTASSFISAGEGDAAFESDSNISFTAAERVEIINTPLKFASFTTTERDALIAENGDVIYNTTVNKFQGYAANTWVDLH
jgi:hypothetical protein